MLTVNDLMTVDPHTIGPDTPLSEIIERMNQEGCRQLLVVDDEQLIGIVTDRDVRSVIKSPNLAPIDGHGRKLLEIVDAEGIMTPNPITVTPETSAQRAAEMLSAYKFGALPVVDEGAPVGIISVTDFLNYIGERYRRPVAVA